MRDLDAYLERIAHRDPVRPDLATLQSLHLQHPLAIPFENVSTVIGEPVPIDLASIESKLIVRRRGGYCFEHNTLFQAVLEHAGFDVVALAARVVWSAGEGHVNPRTHMVLLVRLDGRRWLADVGFGGATLTAPVELDRADPQSTPHEQFRVVRDGDEFVLEIIWDNRWRAMYRFDLQPQLPIDFVALNHYVATHPDSHFRTVLMAGRALRDRRLTLQNHRFSVLKDGRPVSTSVLESGSAIREVLADEFGVDVRGVPGAAAKLDAIAAAGQAGLTS
jgi:N-hydroxyarylamine O-acetyltransferase